MGGMVAVPTSLAHYRQVAGTLLSSDREIPVSRHPYLLDEDRDSRT